MRKRHVHATFYFSITKAHKQAGTIVLVVEIKLFSWMVHKNKYVNFKFNIDCM